MAAAEEDVHRTLLQSKSGTRTIAVDEASGSLFDLPEPPWSADAEATKCEACQTYFSFFNRKHHCRFCGLIFCGKCCPVALPSIRQGFIDPVRLCEACISTVKSDNEFMQKQLPQLVAGSTFIVDQVATNCRLTANHKVLDTGSDIMVQLKNVQKIEDIQDDATSQVSGVSLLYRNDTGNQTKLELHVDLSGPNKKKSLMFIGFLKKALIVFHGPTPSSPRKGRRVAR